MDNCDDVSNPACPVELAIAVFGSKWKLLILRIIILHGGARYNTLLKSIAGVSSKELTRNLRALEAEGLIERNGTTEGYSLTAEGMSLIPIFEAMRDWGQARMAG